MICPHRYRYGLVCRYTKCVGNSTKSTAKGYPAVTRSKYSLHTFTLNYGNDEGANPQTARSIETDA